MVAAEGILPVAMTHRMKAFISIQNEEFLDPREVIESWNCSDEFP
jgi:hypothetical protein